MLFAVLFAFSILQCSFSGYAPTWVACGCSWEAWRPWSSCTATCGGGNQTRERRVWIADTFQCNGFQACATTDMGFEQRSCNTNCLNGGTYQSGHCSCVKGKRGTCCEQTVKCGTPSSISHGTFTGTTYTYGNTIQYHCDADYNMTDPSAAVRTCTESGYWTGQSPTCLYATSCKSSPCQNGATCDNILDGYVCICLKGWTGKHCDTDVQPPVPDNCPQNRTVFTSNMTTKETWKEPLFKDPFGNNVVVTKNYKNSTFTFPWGEFTIQYTATKPSNGLSTECVFNINVRPHECIPLQLPENGIVACNGWQSKYAKVCKMLCKKGYSLPTGFSADDWYNCAATGHWFPGTQPLKCVPDVLRLAGSLPSPFECDKKYQRDTIATHYLNELKSSAFNDLCEQHQSDCLAENVNVLC